MGATAEGSECSLVRGFVFAAMRALGHVLAKRATRGQLGSAQLADTQLAALAAVVSRIAAMRDATQFLNVGLLAEVGLSEAGCDAIRASAMRHFQLALPASAALGGRGCSARR